MVLSDAVLERLNTIKSHSDPLSQAQMLSELKSTIQVPNKDIAEFLGMKPSNVSHLLRVTKLPEIVLDGYMSKQISFTHLILISRLKKPDEIVNLYEEILKNGYTALQTERRIREVLYLVDNFGNYVNKSKLNSIEQRMERSLGAGSKAQIIQTRIKAKIIIEMSGNLAKTTEFIESFSSRFRSKRVSDANNDKIDQAAGAQVSVPQEEIPQNDQSTMSTGEAQELGDNNLSTPSEENSKKYRFDPDF